MERFSCYLFCTLVVQFACGEYGDRIKNATVTWGDNLQMEESRHSYALAPYPPLDPHTELPVTFQAPYINARDYWNDPARRTGFDYNPYTLTKPITDGIHNFYEMMHQFFGADDQPRRHQGPPPPPSPYRQPSYDYQQQRPFYIPQPKPIRAQIQKLEPPRSHFPPYQGQAHPDMFPNFVKILNEVVEENVYKRPEQVLEKPDYVYEYIVPTTYKPPNRFKYRPSTRPSLPVSIQDKLPPVKQGENTVIPYVTDVVATTYKPPSASPGNRVVFPAQPEFVPQLDYAIDVRNAPQPTTERTTTPPPILRSTIASSPLPLANIDNSPETETEIDVTTNGETGVQSVGTTPFPITASSTEQAFNRLVAQTSSLDEATTTSPDTTQPSTTLNSISTAEPLSTLPPEATTNLPARLLHAVTTEDAPTTTTIPETTTEIASQSSDIHTVTELLYTMEPLQRRRFPSPFSRSRTVATTDSTTSADYVTDLTVQGLTDANAVHASVPRHLHTPNVSSVIGYVLSELNATAPPIDFDELSLDAKILKDTNWDGFQSTVSTTSVDTTTDTPTTELSLATEAEDSSTTLSPITTLLPVTTPSTTLAQITTLLPVTTTELPTTLPPRQPVEKKMIVATRMTQSVSRGGARLTEELPSPRSASDEDNEIAAETATTTSTTPASEITLRPRKYQRRQRVHSFTPKPKNDTSTETPLRFTASRPFQPRRSRPNATLTFSSRFSRRNDETTVKLPQRTEEELKVRRNLYRRRNYPSPLRRKSTTESTETEDD